MWTSGVDMYSKRLIPILKTHNCHIEEYSFAINMQKEDFEKRSDIKIISPNKTNNLSSCDITLNDPPYDISNTLIFKHLTIN